MNDNKKIKSRPAGMERYVWALASVWTLVVAASLVWNVVQMKQNSLEAARIQARVAYEKDVIYRRWNAGHGGFYVPVSEGTKPNPYLSEMPERDITTPSGKLLTLMNPAYMTRQVHELAEEEYSVRGHITSLNPIRPENAPDPWETEALRAFNSGETEVSSVEEIEGKDYMRLMRPLITEKGCLKCHAAQGYDEGDIRGGISVSILMEPLRAIERIDMLTFGLGHLLIWLIGVSGIALATKRLRRSEQERKRAEQALEKHTEQLEQRVMERTAKLEKRKFELKSANERLAGEISQRKRAEESLKEMQRYTRGLIEASIDALAVISEEGKITDVNQATELITGMSRKEIIGTDFSNYFTDPDAARRGYQKVFRDGYGRDYPLEIEQRDGKIIPVLFNASIFKDAQGRVAGVFAAARDMTEQKRAEEEKIRLLAEVQAAEVANQAKSDFLASMSHELRTPLNAIIGFSEVLRDQYFGELNEKQAEYTNDILESGKHLLSLINDILDLSKVEAGKMELDLSQVNIKELLGNSLVMIKEKALKHGIALDLKIPEELSGLEIQADERKVKQVMFNLLSNAAKFTPDGGEIRVTVDLISELGIRILELKEDEKQLAIQNPKSKIEVCVADNGIGLSPENQGKIFQEFYQVRGGTTDKTPGTGLGLPLTKSLVEMHDGRIWVESKGEGKGSRFSFLLPIKSEDLEIDVGLLNHLRNLASSYEKHKRPFTLCYLQIDREHFKEEAPRIREAFVKEKRGDDFLVIDKRGDVYWAVEGTDGGKVKVACNRLIKKIKSMFEGLEISSSIATFPEDGETPEAIIKKVRKA